MKKLSYQGKLKQGFLFFPLCVMLCLMVFQMDIVTYLSKGPMLRIVLIAVVAVPYFGILLFYYIKAKAEKAEKANKNDEKVKEDLGIRNIIICTAIVLFVLIKNFFD